MVKTFHTRRFTLRPIRDADIDALHANFSDSELMRYYDGKPLPERAAVRELLSTWRRRERKGTGLRWAIARKEDDRLVGTCGLHDIDRRAGCAEIGCEVSREYWGKRVMQEVAPVIGRHAFETLGLKRLDAYVAPGNRASLHLLGALGFRCRRVVGRHAIINGHTSGLRLFSMTRTRYRVLVSPGLLARLAELPGLLRDMLSARIRNWQATHT